MAIKKEVILELNTGDSGKGLDELKKSFNELIKETPLLEKSLDDVKDRLSDMGTSSVNTRNRIREMNKDLNLMTRETNQVNAALAENRAYFDYLAKQPEDLPLTEVQKAFRKLREEFREFGADYKNMEEYMSSMRTLSELMASGLSAATVSSLLFTRENQFLMSGLSELSDPLVRLQGEEGFGGFSSSVTEYVNDMQNAWTATSVFNETVGADFAESWSNQLKTVRRNNLAIKQEYDDSLSAQEKRTRSIRKLLAEQISTLQQSGKEQQDFEEENDLRQYLRGETEKLSYEDKLQYMSDYYAVLLENHANHEALMDERLAEVDEKDKERRELLEEQKKELMDLQKEENALFKEEYLLLMYEMLEEEELIGMERLNVEKSIQNMLTTTFKSGLKEREKAEEESEEKQKKGVARFFERMDNFGEKLTNFLSFESDYVDRTVELMDKTQQELGEHTVAHKGIAVAKATLASYEAFGNAFAAAPFPSNYVAAASALAAGFKNVKEIVKTEVPDTPDNITTPSQPTPPTDPNVDTEPDPEPDTDPDPLPDPDPDKELPLPRPWPKPDLRPEIPQIQMDDMYTPPFSQAFNMLVSSDEQSQINNISKVYVVETDISETINKVSVKEAEATY